MTQDYSLQRNLTFLIAKAGKDDKGRTVYGWSIWRGRTRIGGGAGTYQTANSCRNAVGRIIDQIRRNPKSPRIVEEAE